MTDPRSSESATPADRLPRPMVWLLEDSPAQAQITSSVLNRSCAVVHFTDSAELIEALQEAQPDVLVLDWEVPAISGLEVLKLVRMHYDEVQLPVLMLTVRNTPEELLEAFDARANDFASKPCAPLELTARVATLARVRNLHRRSTLAERALLQSQRQTEAAVQQLKIQESELRDVTDALPVLVSHVTSEERYALVNRAYEEWFGIPREDLIGRTLVEVIGPAAYAVLSPYVKRGLAGECFSFEQYAVPYRTGGTRDVRVDFVPRKNSDGTPNGYVALLQDISQARRVASEREELLRQTEQARAEAQLERRLQHELFMQAPVPIAIMEGPQHTFSFANPAYRALVNGRDVQGKTLDEALPDLRGQGFDVLLDRVLATGQPYVGTETAIKLEHHRGDEALYLSFVYTPKRNAEGVIDGVLVSAWDVSELVLARTRVEKLADQLRNSERQMRSVLEASGAGLWSLDVASGQVETNERALALLGLPARTRVLLQPSFETIHPEDRKLVAEEVDAVLRGRTQRYLVEFRTLAPDGGVLRWVESRAQMLLDDEQRTLLAGTMMDITERKQLEAQREQARILEGELRRSAERTSRAKDEFMAVLGHELRNPLAPILTVLELMRMKGETQLPAERALIERQARHMARLVDDLLDVSRIATGKIELRRERVELGDVIARAVETAAHLMELSRQQLTVSVPRSGLLVEADVSRLTQVFSNLLTNATKYTDLGGSVSVSAKQADGVVMIEVSDTGRGISAEMLPRVFDLFSQESQNLDRSQGGLGLGLAIVKSMTELHGGHVTAESPGPGKGSTFRVQLPLSTRNTPSQPAPPLTVADAPQASRIKVLIVDDNEDAALLLVEALTHRGCDTRCAYDAAEALELAEREAPQVAVLDIGLPGVDGYQLAGLLRMRLGDTVRLVALTGYGQPDDRARSSAAGFDTHLVKPVALDELHHAIRALASGQSLRT